MKTRPFLTTLSIVLAIPLVVSAEIYNCDGKWTNKPCGGAVQEIMEEKPLSTEAALGVTSTDIEAAKKQGASVSNEKSLDLTAKSGAQDNKTPSDAADMNKRYELVRKLKKLNDTHKNEKKKTLGRDTLAELTRICNDPGKTLENCEDAYEAASQKLTALNSSSEEAFLGKLDNHGSNSR